MFIPVLLWCLGIGLAKLLNLPVWPLFGLGFSLLIGGILLRSLRVYFVLLLCFTLGALRYQTAQKPSPLDAILLQQKHIQQTAEFLVTRHISREARLYQIRLASLAGLRVREPVLLYSDSELQPGQSYSALLEILPGKQDPVLDVYKPLHRAYIRQSLRELPTPRRLFPIRIWRERLLQKLEASLGLEADFAKALLFSDTSAKGVYRDKLTRSGMIHLIVVSGLHVWFIYAVCIVLLNAFLPRRVAELAFMLLILLYSALNNWSPPVLRSVLMIGLFMLGRWRSIPLAREQVLALSLLIITVINPAQLFDIGLQLSYLCIGVILLALPKTAWIKEQDLPSDALRFRLIGGLDYLLLNATVGLAVLPLTLYYFGTASLNGIAGNILGIPLSGALLGLGFLVLIVPGGNLISSAFVSSYHLVLNIFLGWMEWVARLPFYLENTWLSGWQLLGCVILLLSLLSMLRQWKFRPRLLPASLLGILLIVLPQFLLKPRGGIYLFQAGTADCILLRLNDGTSILVDTGPLYRDAEKSWSARKLIPWLKRKGVGSLDWLILTHLDGDHSGGFADLAHALQLKNIIATDETMADPQWQAWQDAELLSGSKLHCISDTTSFQIGGARLKFLHPDRDYYSETDNNLSLLFRLDYQGAKYLFTGDVQSEAEEYLLSRYPAELQADYLKAAHHGSRSSSNLEFVRAVRPQEVWITYSEDNRWGFPHPEPLSNFQRYASSIRSTSSGTLLLPFAQKD